MTGLNERITSLSDDAVIEACKNLKLGLKSELQKRTGAAVALSDADVRQALEALEVGDEGRDARAHLLDSTAREENARIGRALLLAVADDPALARYAEGAVEGADAGVRAIDPVSVLSIAAAVYLVGRLMPAITITQKDKTIEIKPLDDPLKGLSELVKALPFFARSK
jgi:hypothetical protein